MTDFDLLIVSIGLNVCFLAYFYAQRVKIAFLVHTIREAKFIVDCLVDGKATATRGRDGLLKFKEIKHETN
jgi:hypothetical protein